MRLIVVLMTMALLAGCSRVTMENYRKVKAGMPYDNVVQILGKPDSCSDAMIARSCTWGNEKRNITVNFLGDTVVIATSTNLK